MEEDIKSDKTAIIIAESNYALTRKYDDIDTLPTCNLSYRIPCHQVHQYLITRNTINDDEIKDDKCMSDVHRETIRDREDNSKKKFMMTSSDNSDVDVKPKRRIVLKYSEGDLPNSEEIKQFVKSNPKKEIHSSSSSDTENNAQEVAIPLFKKRKTGAKLDYIQQSESLPTRPITRVRKPTCWGSDTILRPKYLTEQEEDIDKEIIIENISRLKNVLSKYEARRDFTENRKKINKEDANKHKHVLRKTSKTSNNALIKKPRLEIKKVDTKKTLENIDCSVKTKINNKRTRDMKKVDKGTKKCNEHKSPKYIKVERETRSKTVHAMQVAPQKHDRSKTYFNSTVGSNHNSRGTRSSNKEQVNNDFVSTKWKVHDIKLKRTCRNNKRNISGKNNNQQKSPGQVIEPRRSRRIKATKDIKVNEPTSAEPEPILKVSVCDQSAVRNKSSNSMMQTPKRSKKPSKFKVLRSERLRSQIIQKRGLRPLKCRI